MLKDWNEQQNNSVNTLDYLAIGFPLSKKMGMGFGVMPFTSVGYSLSDIRTNGNGAEVTNIYTGDGGLNRIYASIGFEPIKDLSLGVTATFNFGSLTYIRVQSAEVVLF